MKFIMFLRARTCTAVSNRYEARSVLIDFHCDRQPIIVIGNYGIVYVSGYEVVKSRERVRTNSVSINHSSLPLRSARFRINMRFDFRRSIGKPLAIYRLEVSESPDVCLEPRNHWSITSNVVRLTWRENYISHNKLHNEQLLREAPTFARSLWRQASIS